MLKSNMRIIVVNNESEFRVSILQKIFIKGTGPPVPLPFLYLDSLPILPYHHRNILKLKIKFHGLFRALFHKNKFLNRALS